MGPILDPNMTLFWALLGPYSAAQAQITMRFIRSTGQTRYFRCSQLAVYLVVLSTYFGPYLGPFWGPILAVLAGTTYKSAGYLGSTAQPEEPFLSTYFQWYCGPGQPWEQQWRNHPK